MTGMRGGVVRETVRLREVVQAAARRVSRDEVGANFGRGGAAAWCRASSETVCAGCSVAAA